MPNETKQVADDSQVVGSNQVTDHKQTNGSKNDRRNAFLKVVSYAKPFRLAFFFLFICILLGISADLLQPYLVKIAIDGDLTNHRFDLNMLYEIAGAYLVLSIISFIFTYLQNNVLQYIGQTIVARLRNDLFSHISKLSMSFFDRNSIGGLVTNVSNDTETISQFFTQVFLSLMRDGVTLVLILFMMWKLNPTMGFYSLLLVPIIFAIAIAFRRAMRMAYQNSRSQLSRLVAFIAENLSGMSMIQAFHQEKEQYQRFTDQNQRYLTANRREVRVNVLFNRSFDMLGNVSVAIITWIGGILVFHHKVEFGVVYAFINYIRQFFQPINQLTQQWNTFQSTIVSMERIWRIFSTAPEVTDPSNEESVELKREHVNGYIDFEHVRFGYAPEVTVIPDFSLRVDAGQFIGIVGQTGAGKSSIISLLTRFYDVQAGAVKIDGVDIRQIPQANLHRIVGLVQQEPFLFSGSILDNVRLFDHTISKESVISACQFVGADSFIERLSNSYHTDVSERGSGLSAGERQLLSFARIVVFQPSILILDEATANLDSHTEQRVQEALRVVSKGRTTLVIAHRLSTIFHADRIIVMQHGRIIESGRHQELLNQMGYYAELYDNSMQKKAMKEISSSRVC